VYPFLTFISRLDQQWLVINTQDTNYSIGGMVINTQDTYYSTRGMVINT